MTFVMYICVIQSRRTRDGKWHVQPARRCAGKGTSSGAAVEQKKESQARVWHGGCMRAGEVERWARGRGAKKQAMR